ncbi:TonB-dependent siderophore receptor [Amaricoccus solimangrovi]|uniref:TonB-dependent siderophore receptor n=1 Tax=Amaricoccus solimangrovi TaxID=2589815 RepID=A0A501WQP5_9RHOB|nr:TonB-dependent siderophore receptor [Amaricoccus solimangrovi]TPE49577.1 TonB-dependent siderophore receptor [Amaricoccus solimangrovi]
MKRSLIAAMPALFIMGGAAGAQEADEFDGETLVLPTLTIDAAQDEGLVPFASAVATKTDTPIERIPQSVSIVTEESLEQRRPQSMEQAISYVPGVVPAPWGQDSRFTQFLVRGFDIGPYGTFRDGLPQKVIGFSGFVMEPYSLEGIDVLKGPNAVLYGETDPGGIVNAVTKRPTFAPLRSGFLTYGPHDTVQAGVDVGGPIGESETLAWRLTGLYRDGETGLENSEDDRQLIAPALTWRPDDRTELTILTNFQSDRTTPGLYLPIAGEDYPLASGDLPDWMWDFSPEISHFDADMSSGGYLFSHEVSPGLVIRQQARVARQDTDYRDFYFNGMASDTEMNYADFTVDETAETQAVDTQAQIDFALWGVENTLLLGLDYSRMKVDTSRGYDASYLIPVDDPSFDFAIPLPGIYYDGVQTVEQYGIYAHNQSQLTDRLFASFGLRQTWVENRFDDHLYGADTSQDDQKLVWDLGATYDLPRGFTPYASYSTGFVVNTGAEFDGTLYEPTEAEQYEIGLRWRPESFNALFSAALYQIDKTNVLTTDPDNMGFWVQTGEVRHRGLELEANVSLMDGLSAVAGYSYIDAEITSSNDGDEGNRPALVPEHEASLWTNYAFQDERFEGLSLGAGVRYVGSSYGDSTNTRETPAHTQVDAALRYARGAVEGALNVTNLFDEDYYALCYPYGGCTKGDGRQVQLTVSLAF